MSIDSTLSDSYINALTFQTLPLYIKDRLSTCRPKNYINVSAMSREIRKAVYKKRMIKRRNKETQVNMDKCQNCAVRNDSRDLSTY